MRAPFATVALFVMGMSLPSIGRGQDYEVRGEIEWINYSPHGATVRDERSSFEVVVNNCRWWMKVIPDKETTVDYHEVSYDGTNVYYVSSIARDVKRRKANGEQVGDNTAVGGVYRIAVPHISLCHEVGPVWLALASGCYFRANVEGGVEPIGPLNVVSGRDYAENAYVRVRADRQLTSLSPHLPERVHFIDDGTRKFLDPFGKSYEKGRLPQPFGGGFTNTTFEVLMATNVAGQVFPRSAEFKTYWISSAESNSWKCFLMHQYRIDCNRVVASARNLDFPPVLPGLTLLNDTRFANTDSKPLRSFVYKVSKRFPTDQQVLDSPDFAIALKGQKAAPAKPLRIGDDRGSQGAAVKKWVLLLSLASATVFLFLLVRKGNLQTKQETK